MRNGKDKRGERDGRDEMMRISIRVNDFLLENIVGILNSSHHNAANESYK